MSEICFKDIKLEDRIVISEIVRNSNIMSNQYSFPNLFCLSHKYNTKVFIEDKMLYVKQGARDTGDYEGYLMPIGNGNIEEAVNKLISNVNSHGKKLLLFGVPGKMKEDLENIFKTKFKYTNNRDWADYIYLSEKMISLSGRKLANKRSDAKKFYNEYGDRLYIEKISKKNIEGIRDFQQKWLRENIGHNEEKRQLEMENLAIQKGLDNFCDLGLEGIVMMIDEKIVAYSYGYPMTDNIVDVIIEKADYKYNNIYRVINIEYIKNCCKNHMYVNREEDIGLEGLRMVKMAYQPEILLEKFDVYEK